MKRRLTTAVTLSHGAIEQEIKRVDLILRDVDHLGCSYTGHVFFNNGRASLTTKRTAEAGYAGSFHVFGHGDCYGAPDHCSQVPTSDAYDQSLAPASLPMEIHLTVTAAFLRASKKRKKVTLTIVPEVSDHPPYVSSKPEEALKFGSASLAVYG